MSWVEAAESANNLSNALRAVETVSSYDTGSVSAIAALAASRAVSWLPAAVSCAVAKSAIAWSISAVKASASSVAALACKSCKFLIASMTPGSVAWFPVCAAVTASLAFVFMASRSALSVLDAAVTACVAS